ncbi:uncharacterized protein LOC120745538 [Scomber scombrus]|uniref:Uncharacterized protein LOC120745538 n=1 Tax=Scomber scombrus TaxID=13677 RepID=A0AAV1N9B8_SCOSC
MAFPDNTRPRRDVRPPRYLDDFLVNHPRRQLHQSHTLHDPSAVGDSEYHNASKVTSDGQTSQSLVPEVVFSALREMREDNNQLRQEMQTLLRTLTPQSAAAPQPPTSSFAAPTHRHQFDVSGASITKAPTPDWVSTPLQHIRQHFNQSEDNPQEVPWPDSSSQLYHHHVDEPFPPPPPPVSYPPPVGAAVQDSTSGCHLNSILTLLLLLI